MDDVMICPGRALTDGDCDDGIVEVEVLYDTKELENENEKMKSEQRSSRQIFRLGN